MTFKDHFSGHARDYARFRPQYPPELFEWLASLVARNCVWDCACGNGQASRQLAPYFSTVFATDASEQQIANAHGPDNIEFSVASAATSGLESDSADLICVAQALHWFDVEAFYAEAARVARPGGVLAVWMYGSIAMRGRLGQLLHQFEHETVGPYWPAERSWIDAGYANVVLPGTGIEAPVFGMSQMWPLDALVGYIGSWSATRRYRRATGADPLPQLRRQLADFWARPDDPREIRWPMVVRAARLG